MSEVLNQNQIAKLFSVQKAIDSKHFKNIFTEGELNVNTTVSKMETVVLERELKKVSTVSILETVGT